MVRAAGATLGRYQTTPGAAAMTTLSLSPAARRLAAARLRAVKAPVPRTPKPSPAEARQRKRREVKALRAELAARFPAAIVALDNEGSIKPLRVGIYTDLAALPEFIGRRKLLRRFLRSYTLSLPYLCAMRAGAVRVGLDGEPAGVVTPDEAQRALEMIDQLHSTHAPPDGTGIVTQAGAPLFE
jgi:ProP effector